MSSMEMIANGMQGPGVRLLHFYGDSLWLVCNIHLCSTTIRNNLRTYMCCIIRTFPSMSVN